MQLQDFGPAIKSLKEQLETDPENIEKLLQLVELYLKVEGDEYYNSVITLDKILELDPNNFVANRIRGLIYKELENEEEALNCFKIILENYSFAQEHPEYKEIHFDYAELLEQLDREDESLEIFEQLIGQNPNDIAVLFKLAHIYTVMDRSDESINVYKKILQLDPENEAALMQLVELYEEVDKIMFHTTKAELALKEGEINRAIAEYRKLIPLFEDVEEECEIRIKIAKTLTMQEEYSQAIDEYNLALDLDENNYEICKGLGSVYYEQEEYDSAIECFQDALKLKQDDYSIYAELADCYVELEKYAEAVAELESYKKHKPDDIDVRCSLAEGYIALRDLYRGKEEIDFVLTRDPNNTRAIGAMVDLNLEKEDFEAALEASKKIVQLIPNSAFSARKMAECYEALKDEYNMHYNYALAYELQSEYGMAIDEYESAHELQPENADILMKIGDLYISMGEKFVGIEYYEKASEADPESSVPFEKLAKFYTDNGDSDRAAEAYASLVEIEPRNSEAHYALAQLYDKQKFLEDALKHYNKYIELAPNSTKSDQVKKRIHKLEKKMGIASDTEYEQLEDGEYIDDRTIFQRVFDFFRR